MRLTILISFLVSVFVAFQIPHADFGKIGSTPQARLKGVVADSNQARVSKAKVIVEGEFSKAVVITNDDGTYSVDLAPGLYSLTVISPGFCSLMRARFELRPLTDVEMNLTLVDCALDNVMTLRNEIFIDSKDQYNAPYKEESVVLSSEPSSQFDLHVRFGKRAEIKDAVRFQGFSLSGDRQVGVTVTYNLMTLRAEQVCLNKATGELEAFGNVVVADGSRTLNGTRVSVKLRGGQTTINAN
jgi:hypothetical protein